MVGGPTDVRAAVAAEVEHLARIWHEGWHEAHAHLLPPELARLRTLESLRDRLQAALPSVRVAGPPGAPLGFCMLKGSELYQVYVTARARGTGVAAALMADAEARLADPGWTPPGLRAPSETSGRRSSTRSAGGAGPGRSATSPTRRMARRRSTSGATRSAWAPWRRDDVFLRGAHPPAFRVMLWVSGR